MKSFDEAVKWVESLLPHGIKPGLDRMQQMLSLVGNPERELPFIHVGGTNGKGSTVSFLRHVLQEANYNVGTFTSPYIEHFSERIAINGKAISDNEFLTIANELKPVVENLAKTDLGSPTEFEVVTAIAFLYFARIAKPDVVVLEVGLGGRGDATNVITPLVSVITNVGHDHMHLIGDTLEKIAFEKAGIVKERVPVVTAVDHIPSLHVIEEEAKGRYAPLLLLGKNFSYENYQIVERSGFFLYRSMYSTKREIVLSMQGEHQARNAAVAIAVLEYLIHEKGWSITDDAIYLGLKITSWSGRFEIVRENPLVILDGAHNIEGMEALSKALQSGYSDKRISLMFAATKEKKVEMMLQQLYPLVTEICFTTFNAERAATPGLLMEHSSFSNKWSEKEWELALEKLLHHLGTDEILLITGSLYFISEVRKYFVV